MQLNSEIDGAWQVTKADGRLRLGIAGVQRAPIYNMVAHNGCVMSYHKDEDILVSFLRGTVGSILVGKGDVYIVDTFSGLEDKLQPGWFTPGYHYIQQDLVQSLDDILGNIVEIHKKCQANNVYVPYNKRIDMVILCVDKAGVSLIMSNVDIQKRILDILKYSGKTRTGFVLCIPELESSVFDLVRQFDISVHFGAEDTFEKMCDLYGEPALRYHEYERHFTLRIDGFIWDRLVSSSSFHALRLVAHYERYQLAAERYYRAKEVKDTFSSFITNIKGG